MRDINTSFWNNIGKTLKNARLSEGLSLRQLGEITGLSYTSIDNVEKARQRVPVDTLKVICSSLGLDWLSVLENAEDNTISHSEQSDLRVISSIYNRLSPREQRKMLNIVKAAFVD